MNKGEIIMGYLAVVLAIASIIDFRCYRIPNWLTYSTLAGGISYFTILKGSEGFLFSLSGAAAGFGLLIIPFIFGGTGAGDVKLLGGVGSFLGPHGVLAVFVYSCILGGVYVLFLLSSKGLLGSTFRRYGRILKGFIVTQRFVYILPSREEREIKIRLGMIIALGTGLYQMLGF